MTMLGPEITVVCRNNDCDQNGIEKQIRAIVIDVRSRLLDWPQPRCGSCLREPELVTGGAT